MFQKSSVFCRGANNKTVLFRCEVIKFSQCKTIDISSVIMHILVFNSLFCVIEMMILNTKLFCEGSSILVVCRRTGKRVRKRQKWLTLFAYFVGGGTDGESCMAFFNVFP